MACKCIQIARRTAACSANLRTLVLGCIKTYCTKVGLAAPLPLLDDLVRCVPGSLASFQIFLDILETSCVKDFSPLHIPDPSHFFQEYFPNPSGRSLFCRMARKIRATNKIHFLRQLFCLHIRDTLESCLDQVSG